MPSYRQERVADLIREQLAELLQKEVEDPRLAQVTITAVEMSPDLRYARVFYSVLGSDQEVSEASQAFESASGYVRRELASRLKLRYMPHLQFRFDSSLVVGHRIETLLKQIEDDRGGEQEET